MATVGTAMRKGAWCALGLVGGAGCSLVTSWEGLPLDREPFSISDASADHATGNDAGGGTDARPPADSSSDGNESADAAPDADPTDCTIGAYYCGGDKLVGDPGTLYECTARGPMPALVCQHGCARRAGKDDACICVAGSPYCGGDQVIGDPQTLYTCNADYSTTVAERCPTQCLVQAGKNDTCK